MRKPPPAPFPRPTRAELTAAARATLQDVIAPGLDVLFCGINPGLYSGATGHHFARPGNRFWPALHAGGFTERVLAPWEEELLLERGAGITNIVARTTATAVELTREELIEGRRRLERKVRRYAPRWLAVAGIGAYRIAFGSPDAVTGPQERMIGATRIWVLPNPSGLNAHHQPKDLARAFRALREASRGHPRRAAEPSTAVPGAPP
ncbi:MAG TPA: G/U mismatch-specific DNA glycosylase [Gemmatimonadales bacterium]|jgi:TDG/mug DNA glycosylase family protein|nr:G/U mismatch-specific DNA glycosylase [Gemmatimonadales bacterium]